GWQAGGVQERSPRVRVLCVPGANVSRRQTHPEGGARTLILLRTCDVGDFFRATQPLIQTTLASVPDPPRKTDSIDSGPGRKLVDGNTGKRTITAPLAFARHDEIEVECVNEAHTFRTHVRID